MFNAVGVWPDADQPQSLQHLDREVMRSRPSWPLRSLLDALDGGVSLAVGAASLDEVRLKWQGLGYYSRAASAETALLLGGPWPRTGGEWMTLPGIGRTTAGSILSSAFNLQLPIRMATSRVLAN